MKKIILYRNYVENENVFEYEAQSNFDQELVDLYIVKDFLTEIVELIKWADIDIFSHDFKGIRGEFVFLEKTKDTYFIGYSFENTSYEQCPKFKKNELQTLIARWNDLMKKQYKYIILEQRQNKFDLHGAQNLSD